MSVERRPRRDIRREDVEDSLNLIPALALSLSLGRHFGSRREFELRNKFQDTRERFRKILQGGGDVIECGARGEGYRSSFCKTTYLQPWPKAVVLCTMYDSQQIEISFTLSEVPGNLIQCKLKLLTDDLSRHHPVFRLCKQIDEDHFLSYQLLQACNSEELGLTTGGFVAGPEIGSYDDKLIRCILCSTWPPQSFSFVQRHSRSGWPQQECLDRMLRRGCYVVPSDDPDDETLFLLSFAVPERELVRSFNQTQLNVFGYWQTIIHEKVDDTLKPVFNESIVKHCLFWLIQECPVDAWIELNVMKCMELLLRKLIDNTRNRSCPHFFVKRYDLFSNMTSELQLSLVTFLQNIGNKGWRFFLELSPFTHQAALYLNLQNSFPQMCVGDMEEERRLDYVFYQELQCSRFEFLRLFEHLVESPKKFTIDTFRKIVHTLRFRTSSQLDDDTTEPILGYLSMLMGCYLTKALPSIKENRLRFAYVSLTEGLLLEGFKADMASGRLKLALLYLYIGKTEACLSLIDMIMRESGDHVINLGKRYTPEKLEEDRINDRAYESTCCNQSLSRTDKTMMYLASIVEYTKAETAIAETGLQRELQEAFTVPRRRFLIDYTICCHYLEVVCKHRLGESDDRDKSIGMLRQLVTGSNDSRNRHVYHNLLGYCLVLANKIPEALAIFTESLRVKESGNAAVRHLEAMR